MIAPLSWSRESRQMSLPVEEVLILKKYVSPSLIRHILVCSYVHNGKGLNKLKN